MISNGTSGNVVTKTGMYQLYDLATSCTYYEMGMGSNNDWYWPIGSSSTTESGGSPPSFLERDILPRQRWKRKPASLAASTCFK